MNNIALVFKEALFKEAFPHPKRLSMYGQYIGDEGCIPLVISSYNRRVTASSTITRTLLPGVDLSLCVYMCLGQPFTVALKAKVDAFYDKEQAKFDEKHKVLLDAIKSTMKHLTKCEVQKRCAKVRIAKKNGFAIRHRFVDDEQ